MTAVSFDKRLDYSGKRLSLLAHGCNDMPGSFRSRVSLLATVAVLMPLLTLSVLSPVCASAPTSAVFSGSSTIHVVVEIVSSGAIVTTTLPSTFQVTATPGGPGVGTLALLSSFTVNGMKISLAADNGANDPVGTGHVIVTPTHAVGGGTLSNTVSGYMSQFGYGATTTSGGQFQCQNTGRSAAIMNGPMSMLLGTAVNVLQMDVHGTVALTG